MKEPLEFYDIKLKTKFTSSDWRIETREAKGSLRYFAVTAVPGEDREAWRIISKDFAKANMG